MTAFLTVCSTARLPHVLRQQRFLAETDPDALRVLAWLDASPPPDLDTAAVVHVPPGSHGLRVAAGRNAAAADAIARGAERLVFLDADCLAAPHLRDTYADSIRLDPGAVHAGPVTYLPEGASPGVPSELAALTDPHPARAFPADGARRVAGSDEYDLFWSLSFALTAATWLRIGGFSPAYEGYGAEDTDFARRARTAGIPLVWVGGAHAYHQWHPTSSPPWAHLDDILRNGATFAREWGEWPMGGWLQAFADAGVIRRAGSGWVRTGAPVPAPA